MGLREQLGNLNRQYRAIEIPSADGESSVTAYYRRPAAAEDKESGKSYDEEFKAAKAGLHAAENDEPSAYQRFETMFSEDKPEHSINAILNGMAADLRRAAVMELELTPPADGASKAEIAEFVDKIRPTYERMLEAERANLQEYPADILARRAAEQKVYGIATERATDVFTRRLVAQSLYERTEAGEYSLLFSDADEVARELDSDTIATIVRKINAEVARSRSGPLT